MTETRSIVLPRRAALLVLVALQVTLVGCGEDSGPVDWRYRLPPGLASSDIIGGEAIVRVGGCTGEEERARFRFANGGSMPTTSLPSGAYGFEIRLNDRACDVVATGCVEGTIPAPSSIVTVLASLDTPVADPGCFEADAGLDGGPDAPPPFTEIDAEIPQLYWPRTGTTTELAQPAASADPSRLTIHWNPIDGIDRYFVEVSDECPQARFDLCALDGPEIGFFTSRCGDVSLSACQTELTETLPVCDSAPVGKRYCFRVRACPAADRCSPPSDTWYVDVGRSWNDFNGDGIGDLAVGMPTSGETGGLFIYYGDGALPETTLTAGPDFRELGAVVAPAGDVDGDGFMDLVAGENALGRPAVFLGGEGGLRDGTYRELFPAFGSVGIGSVAGGDTNNDGLSDVLAGYPESMLAGNQTAVWLSPATAPRSCLADPTCSYIEEAEGPVPPEPYPDDAMLGTRVVRLYDFDLDGYGETVAGAPAYPSGGNTLMLMTRGSSAILAEKNYLSFTTLGAQVSYGSAVSIIGRAEQGVMTWFAISDPMGQHPFGMTGSPGFVSLTHDATFSWIGGNQIVTSAFYLPRLDDPAPPPDGARFGAALAEGNFDGDSWMDLAVSAPGAGFVRVYWGAVAGALNRYTLVDSPSGALGFGVALRATDLDGDGADELIIGAPLSDGEDGRVYRCDVASSGGTCTVLTRPATADVRFGAVL